MRNDQALGLRCGLPTVGSSYPRTSIAPAAKWLENRHFQPAPGGAVT